MNKNSMADTYDKGSLCASIFNQEGNFTSVQFTKNYTAQLG